MKDFSNGKLRKKISKDEQCWISGGWSNKVKVMLDLIPIVGYDILGRRETHCVLCVFFLMAADGPPPFAAECDEFIMLG